MNILQPLVINISVIEAKGLNKKELGRYDPFVELIYNNKINKTKVIKNNQNPTWEDTFKFQIDSSKPVMNLLVWDKEIFFISNNLIGSVILDWRTVSSELERGRPVDKWYPVERSGKPDPLRGWLHLLLKSDPIPTKKPTSPQLPAPHTEPIHSKSCHSLLNGWCILGRNKQHEKVNISVSKPIDIESSITKSSSSSSSNIKSSISDLSIDSECSSSNIHSHIDGSSHSVIDEELLYHCIQCHSKGNPENLFLMEECLHNLCKSCLKSGIQKQMEIDPANLHCIYDSCKCKIQPSLLKEILDNVEYENYLNSALESFVGSSSNFFKCPSCSVVYEKFESKQKNKKLYLLTPSGVKMTEESAKHRDEFRYRCGNCNSEFCSCCNSIPYHYNFNCESYKIYLESRKCRFCKTSLVGSTVSENDSTPPGHLNICDSSECQEKKAICCGQKLACGHNCIGICGEETCPPCFKQKCQPKKSKLLLQNSRDLCNICYTEELCTAPCVQLECGHAFHFTCIKNKVQQKPNNPRLTFKHLECPLCKKLMKHPALSPLISEQLKMKELVQSKASQRLVYEGLNKCKEIEDKNSKWYKNPEGYAMDHYSYYLCFKCKSPYFAGQVRCDQGNDGNDEYNPQELICPSCKGDNFQKCSVHGWDFMEFKCHFCCSVAQWFCWGRVHFCTSCHSKQQSGDYLTKKPKSMIPKCEGIESCPLKVAHPHCEEFSLGCSICKMIKEF